MVMPEANAVGRFMSEKSVYWDWITVILQQITVSGDNGVFLNVANGAGML
jgi:hypothetical protein